MKKLVSLLAVLAVAAVAAVPAFAASKTVKVGDNWFVHSGSPSTVKVHKGTTVVWKWTGKVFHNVTVTRGPQRFHSSTKGSGTFKHKMTKKGTYKIVCTLHPGMEMTLKVS